MERILIFTLASVPLAMISWRALVNIKSHGFYRFFSWECIVWLLASNYTFWFDHPFSMTQVFSWILLLISGYLIIAGVFHLKKGGKQEKNRGRKMLYPFEQTTKLVENGIYKYIRHPMYSSLLFLTWGIFMKNPTLELMVVSILSTSLLFLTAIFDEKECVIFFGDPYTNYMKRSKRFIPYLV